MKTCDPIVCQNTTKAMRRLDVVQVVCVLSLIPFISSKDCTNCTEDLCLTVKNDVAGALKITCFRDTNIIGPIIISHDTTQLASCTSDSKCDPKTVIKENKSLTLTLSAEISEPILKKTITCNNQGQYVDTCVPMAGTTNVGSRPMPNLFILAAVILIIWCYWC